MTYMLPRIGHQTKMIPFTSRQSNRLPLWLLSSIAFHMTCLFVAPNSDGQTIELKHLTVAQFQSSFDKHVNLGLVPRDIQVTVKKNVPLYDVIFEKPNDKFRWAAHHHMSDVHFSTNLAKYDKQKLVLRIHRKYSVAGKQFHVGYWAQKPISSKQIWQTDARIPQSGKAVSQLKPFDDLMVSFLKSNQIPGATIAITRSGRLVYSRGFGVSEIAPKQTISTGSRMRIASLSKPITAVAILRLVELGKLSLDDRVFELLDHRPYAANGKIDLRLKEITVIHCLQHTAGWDRNKSYDPMFRPTQIANALSVDCPPGPDHIIRFMLNQPLDHHPGTQYAYSNFGYSVLGRVIEKITGQRYETFVQENILEPIGISQMQIGKTLASQRADQEVRYYARGNSKRRSIAGGPDEWVDIPYGAWHVESMDAHGGWIATAEDMVRFAAAFDKPEDSPILTRESIQKMFARPKKPIGLDNKGMPSPFFYGCGWLVRPAGNSQNTWHNGLLEGTSTLLVRRHDGLNWAVLFNKSHCLDGKTAAGKIDALLHQAAKEVKNWP